MKHLLMGISLLCLCACGATTQKTKEDLRKDLMNEAFTESKVKIIAVLNDPDSFQGASSPDENEDMMDSSYAVTSYFYAKNGFGGTIKTEYTMNIKYMGGDIYSPSNWKVIELYFDGKKVN